MKNTGIILLMCFPFVSLEGVAQQISNFSLGATSAILTSAKYEMNMVVGEIIGEPQEGHNIFLSQGSLGPGLSISETTKGEEALRVQIYPNPANESLFVHMDNNFAENTQIEISDLQGRMLPLLVEMTNGGWRIDIGKYSSGMYIIKITAETSESLVKRFLKL